MEEKYKKYFYFRRAYFRSGINLSYFDDTKDIEEVIIQNNTIPRLFTASQYVIPITPLLNKICIDNKMYDKWKK